MSTRGAELWWIYLIERRDGRLYVGIAKDVFRRFEEHRKGHGATYLRNAGPLVFLGAIAVGDYTAAVRAERRVKRWRVSKKRWFFETYGTEITTREDSDTASRRTT